MNAPAVIAHVEAFVPTFVAWLALASYANRAPYQIPAALVAIRRAAFAATIDTELNRSAWGIGASLSSYASTTLATISVANWFRFTGRAVTAPRFALDTSTILSLSLNVWHTEWPGFWNRSAFVLGRNVTLMTEAISAYGGSTIGIAAIGVLCTTALDAFAVLSAECLWGVVQCTVFAHDFAVIGIDAPLTRQLIIISPAADGRGTYRVTPLVGCRIASDTSAISTRLAYGTVVVVGTGDTGIA
jgi:hypothetical protein